MLLLRGPLAGRHGKLLLLLLLGDGPHAAAPAALRHLVDHLILLLQRPRCRRAALRAVLLYTRWVPPLERATEGDGGRLLRENALKLTVNQLWPQPHLQPSIRAFAVASLRRLLDLEALWKDYPGLSDSVTQVPPLPELPVLTREIILQELEKDGVDTKLPEFDDVDTAATGPDFKSSSAQSGAALAAEMKKKSAAAELAMERHRLIQAAREARAAKMKVKLEFLQQQRALRKAEHQAAVAAANRAKTEQEAVVRGHLGLFLALCTRDVSLLPILFDVYSQAAPIVQRAARTLVDDVVLSLGRKHPTLLQAYRAAPAGAVPLTLHCLYLSTKDQQPLPELVALAKVLLGVHNDARFAMPVLLGLQKREAIWLLPRLVMLEAKHVTIVMETLLKNAASSPLSPAELIVYLHQLDDNYALPPAPSEMPAEVRALPAVDMPPMQRVKEAIAVCLATRDVVTDRIIATVIRKLSLMRVVPRLFMRTLLQTIAQYPRISTFVMSVFSELIARKIWERPELWAGFVMCVARTQHMSLPTALTLPVAQLRDLILRVAPGVGDALLDYVTRHPHATSPAHIDCIKAAVQRRREMAEKGESMPQLVPAAAPSEGAVRKPVVAEDDLAAQPTVSRKGGAAAAAAAAAASGDGARQGSSSRSGRSSGGGSSSSSSRRRRAGGSSGGGGGGGGGRSKPDAPPAKKRQRRRR